MSINHNPESIQQKLKVIYTYKNQVLDIKQSLNSFFNLKFEDHEDKYFIMKSKELRKQCNDFNEKILKQQYTPLIEELLLNACNKESGKYNAKFCEEMKGIALSAEREWSEMSGLCSANSYFPTDEGFIGRMHLKGLKLLSKMKIL